jgi:hypothetical protein
VPTVIAKWATHPWKNALVHSQLAHAPKVRKNPEKFPHPSCVSEKSQRLLSVVLSN